jgi:hypothetical protein
MPHPISIDGLTEDQVTLLNFIYACDSYDELMEFVGKLDKKTQFTARALIQLILFETIEEEYIKPMTRYPDAEFIINRIKKSNTP